MTQTLTAHGVAPWQNHQGSRTFFSDSLRGEDMLDSAGLNWTVSPRPVTVDNVESKHYRAIMRDDQGGGTQPLAIVSPDYRPLQNRDALLLFDDVLGPNAKYVSAGSIGGGKRVFVTVDLGARSDIAGDEHGGFLLLATGHDGSFSFRAALLTYRFFCMNQLNADNSICIRHTSSIDARITQAKNVLRRVHDRFDTWTIQAQRLALQTLRTPEAIQITDTLFPTYKNEAGETVTPRAHGKVIDLWRRQEQTDPQIAGTRYGYLNAVTSYLDHNRSGDAMARTVAGEANALRSRAVRLLQAA